MAKVVGSVTDFSGKIDDIIKGSVNNSCAFAVALDMSTDAKQMTINPKAIKDSGAIVSDLPMASERASDDNYFYGDTGRLYKESSSTWTQEHIAADSSGNGLGYFGEDDNLYYTQDITIGRYGPIAGTATWNDDFLGQAGGEPTNTNSLDLEASSSQYASRADTASLSQTSDLSLEIVANPESLPSTGNTMTLMSKWDENGNLRSYKMDLTTVSNFFGAGGDGALTIAADTTEAPIDSGCAGTIATYALTATNTSFAADQKIMIHQTRGTNAGVVQYTTIQSYTAGTITTADLLDISFNSTGSNKAQVRVLKQYTNVTINTGKTYTAKAWNGTVGGIIGWYASGTVTVTGTITATGKGFLGGTGVTTASNCGEGTTGASAIQQTANGSGGGGGIFSNGRWGGGGGGGNGTAGASGTLYPENQGGAGGLTSGSTNLTTITFGGGGGGGSADPIYHSDPGDGGAGGGIISIFGATTTIAGSVVSNGADGDYDSGGGGGGGGGGSILFKAQTATLGSLLVTATQGSGSDGGVPDAENSRTGGVGGNGRIHIDYLTSVTGTTTPTLSSAVDSTLGSSDGYALRLQVSDDGTAVESYTQEITEEIDTSEWDRWQITWEASTSTAKFYNNGTLLGSKTGAMTAIDDNASVFTIGADFDTTAQNFYDGLVDDARVWSDLRTVSELLNNNQKVLVGTEANLVGYWEFNGDVTDSQTSGNNDLTASGSPTYSTDVPFSGLTTRNDQDQTNTASGQTYTLTTAINEGATHRQSFVPAKDPQESIEIEIGAIGTGDWTMTVHDALNRELAATTVVTADLNTSFYEFIFSPVWRPVIGATYHFHLTSTVADGTVVTGTTVDIEDAQFKSFYQFLVSDEYHPIEQHLNVQSMGNERYLATLTGGGTYNPHRLTFPSGTRVRSLAFWREFLAIGTWTGDAITDYDQGRIFFWDGIHDTYNFFIDVPEGGVNAMKGTKGLLYIEAGYSGDVLVYVGGDAAQKIKKIPKATDDNSKYVEILPGAMSMWRSLITLGVGSSDSTDIERGVYTWGALNRNFPDGLAFDYPLSLGRQTNTGVEIGVIHPSGQELFIGWKNSNAYGVDKITLSNEPYTSATYESLVVDYDSISQNHVPLVARVDFEPLLSSETVAIKYKPDRSSTWTTLETENEVGATFVRGTINGEMKELQLAIDITCNGTSPTILGLTLESDDASETTRA